MWDENESLFWLLPQSNVLLIAVKTVYYRKQSQAFHFHLVTNVMRSYKLWCAMWISILYWHCSPRPAFCPVVIIHKCNWWPNHQTGPHSILLFSSALFTLTLIFDFFLYGIFPFCTVESTQNTILHSFILILPIFFKGYFFKK